MTIKITRRRAISVLAAAAGVPILLGAGRAQARVLRWEGRSLGANASIQLYHADEAQARAAIDDGLAELARLESIFSLYRPDSVISQLNRDGAVEGAPAEFVDLVSYAREVAQLTDGWFDPTVQPVWQLYLQHFVADNADPRGPSEEQTKAALALVDWRGIQVQPSSGRVALARPGMGLTLNSIGQGYVSDRVAAVLRRHGFENILVDMGEPRALSTKPDGSAWRIGIANPAQPTHAITEISVVDRALATSGGYGTIFDPEGKFTHIINPFTGVTAPERLGVTVIAESATKANALSTPLTLVPAGMRQRLVSAFSDVTALIVTPDGVVETLKS